MTPNAIPIRSRLRRLTQSHLDPLELFDAWLRTRETTGCDRRRVLAVPTYLRGYLDESRETLAGVPRLPAG